MKISNRMFRSNFSEFFKSLFTSNMNITRNIVYLYESIIQVHSTDADVHHVTERIPIRLARHLHSP